MMASSIEIAAQKKELRKLIRQQKDFLSPNERVLKSEAIFNQVEQLPEFINAKCVFAYMAMGDEVQTKEFIQKWINEKMIVLPIVKGNDLELREFTIKEELMPGQSFGILEPREGRLVDIAEIDFAVIPGIAFDKENNRMGRGKGYYDKLLSNASFYKIGVCFNFQFVDAVPIDVFDVKMDNVLLA
ncbi:5-formyltetrahydrofolate cyclo-ligase [Williamwhitmania taraxaci]|uniref:5-formyltetrahydrofolate cyclo-ligase n=1 Tax=Williamwhitmania taraxaci TaxID=1640674 RepID=A0A1G6GZ24_9BACT|nr:5-formyltetrahydrofolate cyclo-ligase [Williamwhitmania taraxaci]SDB87307.1 5-formyltetrahydrofolate cyclo-ligase [Williamwhitmania taraxaci]